MDAIALNIPEGTGRVAPFLDARKEKVYTAFYDRENAQVKKIKEPFLTEVPELLESLKEKTLFFGDAAGKYQKKLETHPLAEYTLDVDWYPKAADIGRIGFNAREEAATDPDGLEPLYLHSKECNITKK